MSTPSSGSSGEEPLTPKDLEKARSRFLFFKNRCCIQVILLGGAFTRDLHSLKPAGTSKGGNVLCLRETGYCEWCVRAGGDSNIGAASPRYFFPALRRRESSGTKPGKRSGKKWVYHQAIAVFTEAGLKELRSTIKPNEGLRGTRLEVRRAGSKYVLKKLRPKVQEGCPLRREFSVMPFIRARYGLPQIPADRLKLFGTKSYGNGDFSAPWGPQPLKLTQEELASLSHQRALQQPPSDDKPAA